MMKSPVLARLFKYEIDDVSSLLDEDIDSPRDVKKVHKKDRRPIVVSAEKLDHLKPDPEVMRQIQESARLCKEYNLK